MEDISQLINITGLHIGTDVLITSDLVTHESSKLLLDEDAVSDSVDPLHQNHEIKIRYLPSSTQFGMEDIGTCKGAG